jgi:hypothetical protein
MHTVNHRGLRQQREHTYLAAHVEVLHLGLAVRNVLFVLARAALDRGKQSCEATPRTTLCWQRRISHLLHLHVDVVARVHNAVRAAGRRVDHLADRPRYRKQWGTNKAFC